VLSYGIAQAGVTVNFTVAQGTATLSLARASSDSSGYAETTAYVTNHTTAVQVTACVQPNNAPCQTFTLFATPPSSWIVEPVSGTVQVVPAGQVFQPLVLRVTDGSAITNPVMGVPFAFAVTLMRLNPGTGPRQTGDSFTGVDGTPIVLGSYETQAVSDGDGLASLQPSTQGASAPCDVFIAASAGGWTPQFHLQLVPSLRMSASSGTKMRAPLRISRLRGTMLQK